MSPLLAIPDLPFDALGLLLLLLISFIGWVKNKFFDKEEPFQSTDDEALREIVWRRQTGADTVPESPRDIRPPTLPRSTIRIHRPTPAVAPPPIPRTVVSEREAALAEAFEHSMQVRPKPRSSHRRAVDRLLRSPAAAKNAILLTEILGPPVALKSANDDTP